MRVDHHARRRGLRLHVRIRLPLIHAPRVRDGRDRRREHLKDREEDQNPRQARMPGEVHDGW